MGDTFARGPGSHGASDPGRRPTQAGAAERATGADEPPALRPAEVGCLVIADVTGYTTYLRGTELEHAQDVLADLTETIVAHLRPTFRLNQLEGDAAFVYALQAEVEASMLLDTIEDTYFAFRGRLRDIDQATSCECNACQLIPALDLKIVSHFGRFVRREVAGKEDLTGPDVIVVHRLLKNTVRERLAVDGYALHTEACVRALGVDPETLGLREHRETFDDIGEIVGYVDDLGERWRYETERRRVYITAAEAEIESGHVLPAPPAVVWDYVTAPEKRALWVGGVDRIDEESDGGRRGIGTTNHCMHGRGVIVQRILDWRPFRYFTIESEIPMIGSWAWTWELEELDGGRTRLSTRAERLQGARRRALWRVMRRSFVRQFEGDWLRLESVLAEQDELVGS